jgi:tetratricopeptide (TPR) repeat protein
LWGPVCPAEDHNIADNYVAMRMYGEATARIDDAMVQFQRLPRLVAAQACAYAAAGDTTEALTRLGELEEMSEKRFVDPIWFSAVYVALGEHDRAFEMLDRAYEVGSMRLPYVSVDPKFDALRDDPRFTELLRRIGLKPVPIEEATAPEGREIA